MNNRSRNLKTLVLGAILAAVTLVLGMTPMGIIPLGFINVTIMCIPVVVGTVCCGLKVGLILGAAFGIASACSAFGVSLVPTSALVSLLMAESPYQVVLMCLVPRLLLPVVVHLVYQGFAKKSEKLGKVGVSVAAAAGSLTNTVLYLGIMLLLFGPMGWILQRFSPSLAAQAPLRVRWKRWPRRLSAILWCSRCRARKDNYTKEERKLCF